jgi:hypothetical protein
MPAPTKFTCFATDVGLKLHQLNTDELRVYLTNELPLITDTVYNNPADLGTAGGYTAGGEDTQNTFSAGNCVGTDIIWTATAAGIGPFQYVVLYNNTAAAKNLVQWWDYGAAVTLAVGETFKVDFGATMFTIV